MSRVKKALLQSFGKALPAVNWAFFIVGLAGATATLIGILPSLSASLWARVTTVLLWLLFAREGYEPLAEVEAEDQA